jgi:hypothetical protein
MLNIALHCNNSSRISLQIKGGNSITMVSKRDLSTVGSCKRTNEHIRATLWSLYAIFFFGKGSRIAGVIPPQCRRFLYTAPIIYAACVRKIF